MQIITSESVFKGHPDKVCDQISDAILDECLKQDKHSRVGVECAIKNSKLWIFGEITTKANLDFKAIARRTLDSIGYKEDFEIQVDVSLQSPDIALGVDKDGAGDQGMMFGYATNETKELMPLPIALAHKISKKVDELRETKYSHIFGSDGKCQVSVAYENGKPKAVKTIVVSAQTKPGVDLREARLIIYNEVLKPLFSNLEDVEILINPTGAFEVGGPYADSGLTGRKIIVDTYGGVGHHGGGAFSGKDPTKVDRSASYYARYVAKAIVKAGLASRCEVAIAYSIGIAEPVSIAVDTFGTGLVDDEVLVDLVKKVFDFKPRNIIKELNLRSTKYEEVAKYGHVGREELNLKWEQVDGKAEELQEALKAYKA